MGAKGARCSMSTKGARGKFLSTLHPNTILDPTPSLVLNPPLPLALALPLTLTLGLTLIKTEYWDRAGGEVGHACNSRKRKKVSACFTV